MASPPKPWKAEYAKSSRSSCKTCKNPIDKENLRLGKMVQASQFDGFMPMWNHAACILRKANQIKSVDDVEGLELLRWEDQQKIRKYIDGAVMSNSSAPAVVECGIEVSQTSRATCRCCSLKIAKGEIRISTKPEGQGARGLSWNHANCYMEKSPTSQVEKFSGWESLSDSDRATLISLVKKNPSTSKGTKVGHEEERELLQESTSKGGAKRKRASESDQKSKISKAGGNASSEKNSSSSNTKNLEDERTKASILESQLEMQTRALWALKDELKKYVTISELREMLEANEQDSRGSELDLRERCADGMLFGALAKCPMCSGSLHYSSGMYRCGGYLSEWSKCSYSTTQPQRVKAKWKIPEETGNDYLLKEEWKNKIEGAETNCLVVCGVLDDSAAEMKKARRMKIPIVREDYLVDCIKRQKKLPFDLYRVETTERTHGLATVKVKGQSAVHESSGLQDSGHILEDGKSIYNTTLNMSDLSTGVNSYYILQIIQDDKSSDCYVFRKWGRVGNEKIGGNKLDEMSKSDAIQEFKRLFLEKTGNSWESWEDKKDFHKQPGRFYPLDIDYGVKDLSKKKQLNFSSSQLAPQLVELMKMLFNVETYRAAMMEFEINLSEMPLGNLAKVISKKFGKGVYFADLVSKSAQYCYTDQKNPVGLMLSVALGEVYELTKSQYMDKPPKGKHSTKGLGKKVPLRDIVVPCGKPVASKVKTSELMYNEYIVYNTAQVKMQFLLKVRFHHKRSHFGVLGRSKVIVSGYCVASAHPAAPASFSAVKCAADCIFAPYFCSEQGPARFAAIHKVFGASNASKLLLHVPVPDRCEAVFTIAYEAQARIRDPVYGCVAHMFALQQQVAYLQAQVMQVKAQLLARNLIDEPSRHVEMNVWPVMSSVAGGTIGSSPVTTLNYNVTYDSISSQQHDERS
ncbi:UNVERIFIED_CONTAM: Poly [ADP-ribose] polymerase 1 [Sesamum angustifolium]|uniref:Poly [ADP-ribose] polymerase n=1 Tax=Sesamum angustifolium TaxID=2727405 RepID=A0AAW2QTQ7_9LAMI